MRQTTADAGMVKRFFVYTIYVMAVRWLIFDSVQRINIF